MQPLRRLPSEPESRLLVASAALAAGALLLFAAATVEGAQPWTLEVEVAGRRLTGTLLRTSDAEAILLGRDGRLTFFDPDEARNFRQASPAFRPYDAATLRGELLSEFGRGFEVSGAGGCLVVHPAGQRDEWAPRFEQLFRSFTHYFAARGRRLPPAEFTLAAVVMPSRADFLRQAQREGFTPGPGVLGYYSPTSNRILMYDAGAAGDDWSLNAETVIHEAAHQAAFNTGVHNRFAEQPRWVVEGLGTLFEAPGVWDARRRPGRADRVLDYRLAGFRRFLAAGRPAGALAETISSDRRFQTNPDAAYAEAWALTFFLCETQPSKYFAYLDRVAARPNFSSYRAPERLADFTRVFGENLALLEAQFLRFVAELDEAPSGAR